MFCVTGQEYSLLGSIPDPVGDLLMLEGHSKDVLVVEPTILHGLDEASSLVTGHGRILFKHALEGSGHVGSHGDVTTHVKVTPLFDKLLHNFFSVVLQQVLNINLEEYRIA